MDIHHQKINPGYLAIIFTVFFIVSLIPVTLIVSEIHFPAPTQSSEEIISYFQNESNKVRITAFMQFCSAIVLGLFVAVIVNRIRRLSDKSSLVNLIFLGGLMATLFVTVSALLQWTLVQPDISKNGELTLPLYFLQFAFGGPGYSVPIGIFIAAISISAWYKKFLPKWLIVFGVILGIFGIASVLDLLSHTALPFIPLTRFPGFIWMIIAGFLIQRNI